MLDKTSVVVQTARQRAIIAFARRKKLKAVERRELAKEFRPMSKRVAWSIAKAYALGEHEEVGEQLEQLIRAWLTLGERRFEIIFRVVRIIHAAISSGLEALDDLARLLELVLPVIYRRRQLFREIEVVKLQLGGELALSA